MKVTALAASISLFFVGCNSNSDQAADSNAKQLECAGDVCLGSPSPFEMSAPIPAIECVSEGPAMNLRVSFDAQMDGTFVLAVSTESGEDEAYKDLDRKAKMFENEALNALQNSNSYILESAKSESIGAITSEAALLQIFVVDQGKYTIIFSDRGAVRKYENCGI